MTLEELINESCKIIAEKYNIGSNLVTGHKSSYFKEAMLLALQQVREATIKECAIKTTWYYNGPEEYIDSYAENIKINRTELLNLDKNSIEL